MPPPSTTGRTPLTPGPYTDAIDSLRRTLIPISATNLFPDETPDTDRAGSTTEPANFSDIDEDDPSPPDDDFIPQIDHEMPFNTKEPHRESPLPSSSRASDDEPPSMDNDVVTQTQPHLPTPLHAGALPSAPPSPTFIANSIMEFHQESHDSSPPHNHDDEPPSMDDDAPVVNVDMSQSSPEPPQITVPTENAFPLPVAIPGGMGTNVSSKKRRRSGGPARAAREAAFTASKSYNTTEDTQT